jgi:hypothetical protein
MVDIRLLSVPKGGLPMRPPLWHPPVALSTAEHAIMKRIRRAKVFVFLRQHRDELFADGFQQELLALYRPTVSLGVTSAVVSSCGHESGQIEQRVAH